MRRKAKENRINVRVSSEKAEWLADFAKRIGTNITGAIEHMIEERMLKDYEAKKAHSPPKKTLADAPDDAHTGGGDVIKTA